MTLSVFLWPAILVPPLAGVAGLCFAQNKLRAQNALYMSATAFPLVVLLFVAFQTNGVPIKTVLPYVMGTGLSLAADSLRLLFAGTAATVWLLTDRKSVV